MQILNEIISICERSNLAEQKSYTILCVPLIFMAYGIGMFSFLFCQNQSFASIATPKMDNDNILVQPPECEGAGSPLDFFRFLVGVA